MSGKAQSDVPSIQDGRLVRYLDGQDTPGEREETRRLLESSEPARERLAELEAASTTLSDALAGLTLPALPELDLPERVGVGRRTPARWQAAAAAVVVLGVGLTVEPVRAFLVSGVERVVELVAPGPEPEPVPEASSQAEPVRPSQPSAVSFVPQGATFVVEVVSPQAEGVLVLERSADDRVTASVVDGSGESLVVLPGGMRIGNGEASTAGYRVSVPAGLETVEVRVAGAVVARIDPAGEPGPWEVALGR